MPLLDLFTWRWSQESQEQQDWASTFKCLILSHLILSHGLKQATCLNSESVWKGTTQERSYRERIMTILLIIPPSKSEMVASDRNSAVVGNKKLLVGL